MNLFKFLLTGICVFILCGLSAQENALWTRYPAISPDGKTIAFNYKGDIYTVNVEGGKATQLTTNPAYDGWPVWSPDSKTLAFASNRSGSMDVYTVPASRRSPHSSYLEFNGRNAYYVHHGWEKNSLPGPDYARCKLYPISFGLSNLRSSRTGRTPGTILNIRRKRYSFQ